MGLVFVDAGMGGMAFDLDVVLHEDAVLQDGNGRRLLHTAIGVKSGRVIDDVIRLPLAGLARYIYEGSVLLVDGACLAMEIGFVVPGIQDLKLVTTLQE